MLVLMVIIGLMASFVAPRFFDQIGKSETKAARAQLDAFDSYGKDGQRGGAGDNADISVWDSGR